MSNQPNWKLIGNLGDVHFIEHGGFLVYTDQTGVYEAEAVVIDSPEDDTGTWTIHRFILDRCTFINGILSDNKFHPDHPAWFADSLKDVASCYGQDVDSLIESLCSSDPLDRASAYQCIGGYHGWDNFDSYPLTFNRSEMDNRYAEEKA